MKPKPGGVIEGIIKRMDDNETKTCKECEGYYSDTENGLFACLIHDKLLLPAYAPYKACEDFQPRKL